VSTHIFYGISFTAQWEMVVACSYSKAELVALEIRRLGELRIEGGATCIRHFAQPISLVRLAAKRPHVPILKEHMRGARSNLLPIASHLYFS
jgi:hypothetical protein